MYTDDTNYLEMLRPLALAELGLEGDGYQLKIDNNGDLLWINQHDSYTRKRHAEHEHSTAYAVLSYLANSVMTMAAFWRQWDINNPKDMAIARKAYLQVSQDGGSVMTELQSIPDALATVIDAMDSVEIDLGKSENVCRFSYVEMVQDDLAQSGG